MATGDRALAPARIDFVDAFIVGLLAGVFSSIVAYNLDLFGKEYAGITLTLPLIFIVFVTLCLAGIVAARVGGRIMPVIYKFGKFGETGGLNWLVDLGVVNLLILLTGESTGLYFAAYKGISFVAASVNSFFWNKYWVFRGAKKQEAGREISKFALATTLGMVVNIAIAASIAYFGPALVGDLADKSWANIATIIGSLTAMIFNFVVYKIWVFKD